MSRPPLEVADLIRTAGAAFIERNRQWLSWKHIKVLLAIARCRTAALGGHLDQCRCRHRAIISYNSCRNRHCPKCQTAARERWIAARQRTSPNATSMWSSHFLHHSLHWLCRTRKSSTICVPPVQKLFSKSLAIETPRRKSASSPCCIPGIRSSGSIPMSIASFPPVGCRPITPTG